jgi:myo-inositol-1(or 4)-monophosphatase
MSLREDLDLLTVAAEEAGRLAVERRRKGLRVRSKPGGSPVTDADEAVDRFLTERLRAARPGYGWLSEETADDAERLSRERLFVVDPIDGTVAFIKNKPWWTVALAIVEDGAPVAAVVHAPVLGDTYAAVRGEGVRLNGTPVTVGDADALEDMAVLADPRLFDPLKWEEPWPELKVERRNSIALRMALVAAGGFDAAVAPSAKWDWDVAAGALLVAEAGGLVTDHLGVPFRFNQADPRQPGLVCAAPALHALIVQRCTGLRGV